MGDLHPATPPGRVVLDGGHARLEPVDPVRHGPALHAAASSGDPALWDFLPYGPFAGEAAYVAWLTAATGGEDPLFFAIADRGSGVALGHAAYLDVVPAHATIEIGHVLMTAAIQRTPAATEAILLLLAHAFEDLGNRRVVWKCDAANARSRRAAERFGFTYEGTFRQHLIVKGRNRDTAWFAMLDGEWPVARAAFEAWLDPANFDAAGVQRRSLQGLRGG